MFLTKLLLVLLLGDSFFNVVAAQAGLKDKFKNQSSITWEDSKYRKLSTSLGGGRIEYRFAVDSSGQIWRFRRTDSIKTHTRVSIGILGQESSTIPKPYCTSGGCMPLMRYTKLYEIEGCDLVLYSQSSRPDGSLPGKVTKEIVGSCFDPQDVRKKEVEEEKQRYKKESEDKNKN